ncbi:MAG: beta-lactamase family protein, partial [Erythrobacter sp.]|nr:beta-lactamase family protein [Erythrobacter sp.]
MVRVAQFIVFFLTFTSLSPAAAREPAPISQDARELQSKLDALQVSRPDVPGFAIAVIEGQNLFSAASGSANPEGTAMTARTPFRLASVTKTFVAAALLRLSEDGKLDLDASISDLIS